MPFVGSSLSATRLARLLRFNVTDSGSKLALFSFDYAFFFDVMSLPLLSSAF